jgi:hypothetical protein
MSPECVDFIDIPSPANWTGTSYPWTLLTFTSDLVRVLVAPLPTTRTPGGLFPLIDRRRAHLVTALMAPFQLIDV